MLEPERPKTRKKRKRLPVTPRSQVRSALRQLSMRSRERANALKLSGYTCSQCGVKQSKAKGREVAIVVHHINGENMLEELIDLMYKMLLNPANMVTLCVDCHKACHDKEHESAE